MDIKGQRDPSLTYEAVAALMLCKNGYNPAMQRQEAGYVFTPTAAELTSWVREGYVPTNQALATAGEGGTYIGALPVGTPGLRPDPEPTPDPVITAPS